MQIEVNIGLCKLLFNQSEAGILVGGMAILDGKLKPAGKFNMSNSTAEAVRFESELPRIIDVFAHRA